MTVLELRGIVKSYGGVHALKGVDLRVSSGEVVCLLGENGAGKSTLANIISGQAHRDDGDFLIDGESVDIRTPASAHQHGIRTVPQELMLAPAMSVAENILLGQIPAGLAGMLDRGEMARQAAERLQRLSLGHLPVDLPVQRLRVVEQVFVQIARAMTPGCRFLVADEPTAPMSGAEANTLLRVLESITASGVGVVFVSHRLGEVLRIGHRVEVLRDGRNALSRQVEGLSRAELVQAMIGKTEQAHSRTHSSTVAGQPALEISGLSAGLLDDFSLTVSPGEIVGVYGGAGSGKEDLGPALFSVQRASAGEVRVNGRLVERRNAKGSIDGGIAYVPAERRSKGVLLNRSIRDNITLSSLNKVSKAGVLSSAAETRTAQGWRTRLGIKSPSVAVPVGSLSGGNQQKVLLSRWLELATPVVVLDEPTRGVDVGTKAEIYELLETLARQGAAVLVITSDAEELSTCCTRVAVLRNGAVVSVLVDPAEDEILVMADAE